MSYITVETDIDLDDYSDEIIYMFKRNKRFRENLLQAMEDDNIGFVLNRGGDYKYDDRKTQLSKISENYWKLTVEDEELINKIADRF
jgi:hypothetical protein